MYKVYYTLSSERDSYIELCSKLRFLRRLPHAAIQRRAVILAKGGVRYLEKTPLLLRIGTGCGSQQVLSVGGRASQHYEDVMRVLES